MPDNIDDKDDANNSQQSQDQDVNTDKGDKDTQDFDPRLLPNADEFDDDNDKDKNPNQDPEYKLYLEQKETRRRQELAKNSVEAARLKMQKTFDDGDAPEEFRKIVMERFEEEANSLIEKGRPQNDIFKRAKDIYNTTKDVWIKSYVPLVEEREKDIENKWGRPHGDGEAPRKDKFTIKDWMKLPEKDRESRVKDVAKVTENGKWF